MGVLPQALTWCLYNPVVLGIRTLGSRQGYTKRVKVGREEARAAVGGLSENTGTVFLGAPLGGLCPTSCKQEGISPEGRYK